MKKNKENIVVLAILFLSFIFLIIMRVYAKYNSDSNGNSIAKVARWEMSVDTNDNLNDNLNIVSGNTTQDYKLKIISTSEVTAKYSIVLSDIPDNIQVSLDNSNAVTPVNNKITFSDVGAINSDSQNKIIDHTLTFSSPLVSNFIFDDEIYVDVIFYQVN